MQDPKNLRIKSSLLSIRTVLQAIIHEETAFALYRLCRKHFECWDKAGKMLALQLKQLESKQCIPAVRNAKGTIIKDQSLIGCAFRELYSDLYQSECPAQDHNLENFLKNVSLPVLNVSQIEELENSITTEEIMMAVKSLATGKSPGGDGFTSEFYKCFVVEPSPLLIKLYNDMTETQSMPLSMRTATICLLPKPGRDHQLMTNYRPLSLLNNDYKVFAKILALHLEKVVPSLINLDQAGFIAGRQASNNMRRLFHIIHGAGTWQYHWTLRKPLIK